MASTGVMWTVPPSVLQKAIEQYGDKVIRAIEQLAAYIAAKAQNDARLNARWHDRTGNARTGLVGLTETLANGIVVIYLTHSMTYGVYLELCNSGKYAILMPTLESLYPELMSMLDRLLK